MGAVTERSGTLGSSSTMSKRDYFAADFGDRRIAPFWATNRGTKILLIALIAIHLLFGIIARGSPSAGAWIRDVLYLNPQAAIKQFYLWQLLTAGFFHAPGLGHLFWNGIMLWWFGTMVEGHLGTRRFLWFYGLAVVAGSLAYLAESVLVDKSIPMLGASGAVNAVMVYAACLYPSREILLFFVIRLQLWVAVALAVVADLIMITQIPGGVAYSAHLGGALFGFLAFRYGAKATGLFDRIDQMGAERERKKARKRAVQDAELRAELDRILDKVNRDGMTALSDGEKKFLKDASNRLQQ